MRLILLSLLFICGKHYKRKKNSQPMSFLGKRNLYAKYDVGKTHIPSEQTCVTNVATSNIAFSILGQWKNAINGNGLQF